MHVSQSQCHMHRISMKSAIRNQVLWPSYFACCGVWCRRCILPTNYDENNILNRRGERARVYSNERMQRSSILTRITRQKRTTIVYSEWMNEWDSDILNFLLFSASILNIVPPHRLALDTTEEYHENLHWNRQTNRSAGGHEIQNEMHDEEGEIERNRIDTVWGSEGNVNPLALNSIFVAKKYFSIFM